MGDSEYGLSREGDGWHEYTGHVHMHTVHSDGTGTYDDLRRAAHQAGLHFLVVTDHNVMVPEEEGYQDGLLVLSGVEVNDLERQPLGNHLLCLGVRENPVPYAPDPQRLIDAVHGQGGMAFLAHPLERNSHLMQDTHPWHDWEVTGYQGVELWNYMAELRQYASSRPRAVAVAYLPALFSAGPLPEMLEKWDELSQARPVVAISGSDAHAFIFQIGPLRRVVYSYRHCLRTVNTHILNPAPLTGDLAADRAAVYAALAAGHCWTGYDLIGDTTGFRFAARSGSHLAIMGDTLVADGPVRLEVNLPGRAELRIVHNGQVKHTTTAHTHCFVATQPGVYRVEAWRQAWFRPRGWIFSNPIYVR